ncbi:MAG: penicillin-binding protein 2 [candidate division FCPU426 bacterium]
MLWEQFLERKTEKFRKRIRLLGTIMVACLGLLVVRLAYLQVWEGSRYRELSLRNRIRLVPIKAQRGLIYDRNGELLVGNVPTFSVALIPALFPSDADSRQQALTLLESLLGLSRDEVETKLKNRGLRYYEPLRLKTNIDRFTASRVEEHRPELPGVVVFTESRRNYPQGALGFHVLGYVGEISEHELALRDGYQTGDIIGQLGVEKAYDQYLKGRNGWLHIEVDALGRQKGILGREDPWPGHNLILTLDRRLQARAEELLGKQKGVILLEEVKTGGILAMASSPSFDPNGFARGLTQAEWEKLRQDRDYPLTNRAMQGLYPPGSIFKIVTLVSALEEHLVTPQQTFLCKGVFWISTWPYRCWQSEGHGLVSAHRSLVESCDIYYYHLGLRVKIDKLGRWAKIFGYGQATGVDLPNELAGLVPSAQWKERTQNMPWFPGNTVMMSIGQGFILATPLQILGTIVAVANRGPVYKPHLLKAVQSRSGRLIHEVQPALLTKVPASSETWDLLQRGLLNVVQKRQGTGKRAQLDDILVAGKTATAQNPHGEDHAGFAAYAPANKPEVAVLVYLENAGGGGSQAAPLARDMLEAYFGAASSQDLETP